MMGMDVMKAHDVWGIRGHPRSRGSLGSWEDDGKVYRLRWNTTIHFRHNLSTLIIR